MYKHENYIMDQEEEGVKNDESNETPIDSVMSVISESEEEIVRIDETCDIVIESGQKHTIEVEMINSNIVDIVNDENPDEIKKETSNKNVLLPDTDKIPSGKIFKCEKCDFAATRRSIFNGHKLTSHNWCNLCFSSFNNQEDLRTHLKTHSKKKMTGTGKVPR